MCHKTLFLSISAPPSLPQQYRTALHLLCLFGLTFKPKKSTSSCRLMPPHLLSESLQKLMEPAGTMIRYWSGSIILISFDCNIVLSHGFGNFCNDSGERCGGGISRQEEAYFFSLNVWPKRQRRCRAVRYCRGREGGAEREGVLLQTWFEFLFCFFNLLC